MIFDIPFDEWYDSSLDQTIGDAVQYLAQELTRNGLQSEVVTVDEYPVVTLPSTVAGEAKIGLLFSVSPSVLVKTSSSYYIKIAMIGKDGSYEVQDLRYLSIRNGYSTGSSVSSSQVDFKSRAKVSYNAISSSSYAFNLIKSLGGETAISSGAIITSVTDHFAGAAVPAVIMTPLSDVYLIAQTGGSVGVFRISKSYTVQYGILMVEQLNWGRFSSQEFYIINRTEFPDATSINRGFGEYSDNWKPNALTVNNHAFDSLVGGGSSAYVTILKKHS